MNSYLWNKTYIKCFEIYMSEGLVLPHESIFYEFGLWIGLWIGFHHLHLVYM